MQLTDLQWAQVASIIAAGVPIESFERNLSLQRYEITKRCCSVEEVPSFVFIRSYKNIIPLEAVPENWLTASELALLGVSIMGRGVKVAGRIATRCSPMPEIDSIGGEIVVASTKRHNMYCLPKDTVLRWWELRPEQDSLLIRNGDQQSIDMLMRKLAVLVFDLDSHWSRVDLLPFKSELLTIKETTLTDKEKRYERESYFQTINRKKG
jgi:hypothetical protein